MTGECLVCEEYLRRISPHPQDFMLDKHVTTPHSKTLMITLNSFAQKQVLTGILCEERKKALVARILGVPSGTHSMQYGTVSLEYPRLPSSRVSFERLCGLQGLTQRRRRISRYLEDFHSSRIFLQTPHPPSHPLHASCSNEAISIAHLKRKMRKTTSREGTGES